MQEKHAGMAGAAGDLHEYLIDKACVLCNRKLLAQRRSYRLLEEMALLLLLKRALTP